MKITLLIFLFLFSYSVAISQHQISFNGGWTASKIVEFIKPGTSLGSVYNDLHAFPINHGIYGAIEYEYTLHPFKLSTGISATELGTSRFILGSWVMYYINIPIMVGYQWKLPKNFSITLEGGAEVAVETSSTVATNNKWQTIALGTIGLEASWKRLKFGLKGHFSINPFRDWKTSYLHHSGITTYVGYVLFDSEKNKKKRSQRRRKNELNPSHGLLNNK